MRALVNISTTTFASKYAAILVLVQFVTLEVYFCMEEGLHRFRFASSSETFSSVLILLSAECSQAMIR